jgi:hypothetical protein
MRGIDYIDRFDNSGHLRRPRSDCRYTTQLFDVEAPDLFWPRPHDGLRALAATIGRRSLTTRPFEAHACSTGGDKT